MTDLESRVSLAVKRFWTTRDRQAEAQGRLTGQRDAGHRTAVTGGKQLEGFVELFRDLLCESGVEQPTIYCGGQVELPGWFRASKKWDLLFVSNERLIATIECKSIVGSFGNNLNNRTEEALGSATDLMTAYREGAFKLSLRPWLGYLLLIQDAHDSRAPVTCREPHFPVFREFRGASYIDRSAILLTRLVRDCLYDAACLIASDEERGRLAGEYSEPSPELAFRAFTESLLNRALAHRKMQL